MSRSELSRKEKNYLSFRTVMLEDFKKASAEHNDDEFTKIIEMIDLLIESPDSENEKYFRKRLLEDLQNKEFTFGVTATVRAILGCCLEHYNEPSYEILAPLEPSLTILKQMLAFNEALETNFFPISESVKDVNLDRMRKTKERLLPMLSNDAAAEEEIRALYDELTEKLSSLKKPVEERTYNNPLKNILHIIRKATCTITEGGDDRTEADVWEAFKRLYDTRKKGSETTRYIKPIIDILALSVRDEKTQLLSRRGLYEGTTESGGRPYAGVVSAKEKIMMVSGESLGNLTGVIAHEATHLADFAISSGDIGLLFSDEHSDRLGPILLQINENLEKLPDQLQLLRDIESYPPESQKTELLAFSIQLISLGEENLLDLKEHLPDLIKFFDEVFTPKCHEFIKSKPPLEMKSFADSPGYGSSDDYGSGVGAAAARKRKTPHATSSAGASFIASNEKADPSAGGGGGSLFPVSVSAPPPPPPSGSVEIQSAETADPALPPIKKART